MNQPLRSHKDYGEIPTITRQHEPDKEAIGIDEPLPECPEPPKMKKQIVVMLPPHLIEQVTDELRGLGNQLQCGQ